MPGLQGVGRAQRGPAVADKCTRGQVPRKGLETSHTRKHKFSRGSEISADFLFFLTTVFCSAAISLNRHGLPYFAAYYVPPRFRVYKHYTHGMQSSCPCIMHTLIFASKIWPKKVCIIHCKRRSVQNVLKILLFNMVLIHRMHKAKQTCFAEPL